MVSTNSSLSKHINGLRSAFKAKPLVTIKRHVRGAKLHESKMRQKAERAKRTALIRQAAYCKTVARRMLKPAKLKPSQPGSPPRLRGGSKLFKLSVQWGYNSKRGVAVVGPVQVTNRDVPQALEVGGRSTAIRRLRRPLSESPAGKRRKKKRSKRIGGQKRSRRSGHRKGGNRKIKFKTAPRGPTIKTRQTVKARPFMVPAQKITLTKFSYQFKGTFK